MTSEELRLTLIRQTQAIRKALYHIESILPYYEKIVEEEHRAKETATEAPSHEEASGPPCH